MFKLKNNQAQKTLHFKLKTVTIKTVKEVMKSMKNKKSAGKDTISQEILLLGKDVLAEHLTEIINESISTSTVPNSWKEAVVTPILKKGCATDKTNYRPVSCLVTASKVMEKIVCNQITKFLEDNKLLPISQHGFRQKHSTMTAHSNMQKDWTANTEDGLITGLLIWDLSAAFDTLDPDLLISKLAIYGFDKATCDWFGSFLKNRTQKVRIGQTLSEAITLK